MYTREEAKVLRKEFWILFGQRCEIVPELAHRKKKWVLYDTKISGIDLKFDIDQNEATVMIEINPKSENRRLQIFEILEKYKGLLEVGFPDGLEWNLCVQTESGKEVSLISTTKKNVNIYRQDQWPDIYNFLIDNMLTLERNFMELRDLILEEL